MSNLTDPRQALELVHALLSKSTDTLTLVEENTSRTEQTSVSVHTDAALTVTDTTPPASVSVSVPSVHTLTVTNAIQDEENPSSVSASVHFLDKNEQKPTRDPDPSGCPTHWLRLPELPPRGSRVAMVDERGLGNLYRFKVKGVWYLLKFLPPFDGRVSLTDQQGRVRVLASLDEAANFLALVTEDS